MHVKIGDTVQTGVYVCGEFKAMWTGIIVGQSDDGSLSEVDIGSLRGCQPWIKTESTCTLRKVSE